MFLLLASCLPAHAQDVVGSPDLPQPVPRRPTESSEPKEMATVRGVVKNAVTGAALERALVSSPLSPMRGVLTDSEGRFELHDIPVGYVQFNVKKPGYYSGSTYDATDSAVYPVHVAKQMPELEFSLLPLNAIAVHVNLASGMPASVIGLSLLRQTIQDGRTKWVKQNGLNYPPDGQLRFSGLYNGNYLLQSQPEFENQHLSSPLRLPSEQGAKRGYAPVFPNGSTTLAGAEKISLSGGQTAEVSLMIPRSSYYDVHFAVVPPPTRQLSLEVTLTNGAGENVEFPVSVRQGQGVFASLPDGDYRLTVRASNTNFVVRPDMDSISQAILQRQIATANFTVNGRAIEQRMVLGPAGTTAVRIRYSPGPPKPAQQESHENDIRQFVNREFTLGANYASNSMMRNENAVPVSDTEQALGAAIPGPYWISASTSRDGVCVGEVTADGQNLGRVPWVAQNNGAGPPIDVELRTDCAQLTISLPAAINEATDASNANVFVYLVPEFDSVGSPLQAVLDVSSGRSVPLHNVTPGRYRIYAFHSQRELEFHNAAAMDKLGGGQEVTLEPGATASVVLEVVHE